MTTPHRLISLLVGAAFTVAATAHADGTAAAPDATASAAPTDQELPRPSFALCVGVGAGGLALLAIGGALGGLARSRASEQDGNVGNPPLYTPALSSRAKQGETMADIAYAAFAVGGAMAIADIVLWAEKYRSRKQDKAHVKADGINLLGASASSKTKVTPGLMSLRVTF